MLKNQIEKAMENVRKLFSDVADFILPRRTNFSIVEKLDDAEFSTIADAPAVFGCDWIHALFPYKDKRIRAVVWELKYRENTLPLAYIGRRMFDEITALISDIVLFDTSAEFLLIPIPISAERRAERGYNQSELIAKAALENDSARTLTYAPQWLEKIRATPRQSHSESKQQRATNLIGCFRADPRVENKYIILIDDVVTTGSTLSEARRELFSVNARDIFAFTIAH